MEAEELRARAEAQAAQGQIVTATLTADLAARQRFEDETHLCWDAARLAAHGQRGPGRPPRTTTRTGAHRTPRGGKADVDAR